MYQRSSLVISVDDNRDNTCLEEEVVIQDLLVVDSDPQSQQQTLMEHAQPRATAKPLIQPMTELQVHRLLDSLVKRTSNTNLENLEHLASILTIVAIQTGKIDVESLMYELN